MLWCNPPSYFRRITTKKSFSDFTLVRKANLSRGDSKQSDRTLVGFESSKELKYTTEHDVLLINAPAPPPKDSPPNSPPPPSETTLVAQSVKSVKSVRSETSLRDKPLPIPEDEEGDAKPEYPWYSRRLMAADSTSRYTASQPSLLPRCDFALSTPGSTNAGLNLFGGLVNDRAKNDVYSISVKDLSVTRLYTIGDIPPPRFGHASAFAGSVVVVWGGDALSASSNQLRANSRYDNGLYFLNLVSREWTRVSVDGPAPSGRVGHSVVMVGPRIYIFGGTANREYFNDLWCFDLSTLVSRPAWEHIELPKGSSSKAKPPKRAGHTCVAYENQLIMFGGTDGQYHYNDTWAFDLATKTWSEIPCIGYIPAPREGHAATLVDDIMYVFGGRGVDGANMGQLSALKLSSKRWFMFQKMGPEPSPRSSHGMVSVGTKVYVLGGVSEDDLDAHGKDADIVHILETGNIKYPPTKFAPPQTSKLVR